MKNRFLKPVAALLAGLLAPLALLAAPAVGSAAPAFSAKDIAGNTVNLADLKGKVVVLEWYDPKCPVTKKFYAPGKMQELQKAALAKGVAWYSVYSKGSSSKNRPDAAALTKISADWKSAPAGILDDGSGDLARLYAAKTTPHMFIIGADGALAYDGAIDSVRSSDSDDIAKAAPIFANALTAVIDGKPVENATNKPYGCGLKLDPAKSK